MLLALPATAETAVVPEKNPPGDIPDSQAFVAYAGDGYVLKVPEGWARKVTSKNVSFASKLDGVSVTLTTVTEAPTLDTVEAKYAADLTSTGRAVKVSEVTEEALPGGKAIRIDFPSNSEP
jgi:hypothetical protein